MPGLPVAATSPIKGGSFLIESPPPESVFTPEDLSDEHRLIAQTAQEFMDREIVPRLDEIEEKKPGVLRELLRRAAELGFCATDIPQKFGGLSLDKVSSALVAEKMARDGSWAATLGAQAGIGALPIAFFGTEAQKAQYLPKLARGEWVGAYSLSEATSASDALNAKTRATLSEDGKHYLLNGTKMWVTNGGIADVYVVFAKVNGERFTAFIVERTFPGVCPGAEEHKMGIRGSSTTPLNLDNARVPAENVLGEIGKGHLIAFNILNLGRHRLGVGCLGASKYLLADVLKWAVEREAFHRKLAEFGLIQEKLGEMVAQIYALESLAYRTSGMIEAMLKGIEGGAAGASVLEALQECAVECSILKVVGTETLDFVSDEAVQIFGGYGFCQGYAVERCYRDQRVNRIFEGTNEINRLLITDMLVKRSLKGQLPLLTAAQKVAREVLEEAPEPASAGKNPLAREAGLAEGAKKAALLVAGSGVQRFQGALEQEQEVIGAISNLVMLAYAMESATLRARKNSSRLAPAARAAHLAAARTSIAEAADRAELEARRALTRITAGDELRLHLALIRRFFRRTPPDVIGLKRQLAAHALELGRYPFA